MSKSSNKEDIDFSMLLASSVHDIKNSLGMLLDSLTGITESVECEDPEQKKVFSTLHREASRINHALIHLLGLYRLQNDQLCLSDNEVFINDFLEEQVSSQQLLFELNDISVEINCDEDLVGHFDENLIGGVVTNILVNCAKYTREHIELTAITEGKGKGLQLSIQDDGQGYPEQIINHISNEHRGLDFNTGSTNLGLFFAQEIAKLHHCRDKYGHIELSNTSQGGKFSLYLP